MVNRLKEIIRAKSISQKELAERLHMTPIALSQLVNSPMVKISTFEKIASALKIPVWQLCLSDEEIAEIRENNPVKSDPDIFYCPKCGQKLKVIIADEG